jgi:S-(hydroxymethyl)glutathione synthase
MISLHPSIDGGVPKTSNDSSGGKLRCHCSSNPVEVTLQSNVAHQHACGCSQCWKPPGALFSIIGVVPKEKLTVTANENKLHVIDPSALIIRHACKECGVHMYGPVEKKHAFQGLDFVHTELSKDKGWQSPQFAAFVSSIIEQGFDPNKMDQVRSKIHKVGLEPYDVFSPGLMDFIATWKAKQNGMLP